MAPIRKSNVDFWGVVKGKKRGNILEDALLGRLGCLLGNINAKILVMPANSGAYSQIMTLISKLGKLLCLFFAGKL